MLPKRQTNFLEQLAEVRGDLQHHLEVCSFLFGGIVDRANEAELVEALAAMQGMNVLAYSMLQLRGFDLDSLRQKAEALVHGAVELNNLRAVR
jgi:hypothetical protein